MKKVHCFIVPNGLQTVEDRKRAFVDEIEHMEKVFGVKLEDSDLLVQTWTLNPEQELDGMNNYEAHGVDGDRNCRYPWCTPVKLFKGKKEGDVISFSGTLGDFEVTLKQQGYRYERFGTFDKVLNTLVAKAKAYVAK